jgi:hypothetical protein
MARIIYKEEQKFRQPWIWIIILGICGLWLWQFVQQIIIGTPFGNNPAPDLVIILTGIIPLLAVVLFRILRLETVIDNSGIYYRFRPFQLKSKQIKPEDILTFEVKKYNPLRDYGGWGIRIGYKGKAYNVSGNHGALFKFKNGKSFLLGTQNPENLRSALNKLLKGQPG